MLYTEIGIGSFWNIDEGQPLSTTVCLHLEGLKIQFAPSKHDQWGPSELVGLLGRVSVFRLIQLFCSLLWLLTALDSRCGRFFARKQFTIHNAEVCQGLGKCDLATEG